METFVYRFCILVVALTCNKKIILLQPIFPKMFATATCAIVTLTRKVARTPGSDYVKLELKKTDQRTIIFFCSDTVGRLLQWLQLVSAGERAELSTTYTVFRHPTEPTKQENITKLKQQSWAHVTIVATIWHRFTTQKFHQSCYC